MKARINPLSVVRIVSYSVLYLCVVMPIFIPTYFFLYQFPVSDKWVVQIEVFIFALCFPVVIWNQFGMWRVRQWFLRSIYHISPALTLRRSICLKG